MASGSGGVSVRAGPSPRIDGARAGLRRAQRRHLHKQARDGRDRDGADPMCAQVCSACGRLAWPDPDRHPHRREASTGASTGACTHCGERSWIDLGHDSTALALRTSEEEVARISKTRRRRIALRALIGAVFGGVAALLVADPPWTTSALAILSGFVVGLHAYRQHRLAVPPRSALPSRWSMALPPPGRSIEEVRGPANPTGDSLTAPLTGRPCVAYEVGARFDDDSNAPPATWALLEQRMTEVEIDGHDLDVMNTHLELPRERLGGTAQLELEAPAQIYLRQRGLGAEASALVLYESLISPGASVQLEIAEQGATLRPARQSDS